MNIPDVNISDVSKVEVDEACRQKEMEDCRLKPYMKKMTLWNVRDQFKIKT